MQSAHRQEAQVLQVPCASACHEPRIDHVGRDFLPASTHVGGQPDLVSGAGALRLGEGNSGGHKRQSCACASLRSSAIWPKLLASRRSRRDLSHDFVEAPSCARADTKVWLAADVGGSWEEVPSNVGSTTRLVTALAQGNLQQPGPPADGRGLHWLSRIHLITCAA